MNDHIEEILNSIEKQHNVTILFACEAGSRAYELHTPSSDYDVRFIYKYEYPRYLELYRPKDVIISIDKHYDIQGWDVYKALHLFTKSNPSLYEWIHSSIYYRNVKEFREKVCLMMEKQYSLKALGFHYFKLLHQNSKRNLKSSVTIEDIKVVLHMARAYMALTLLIQDKKLPPTSFFELVNGFKDDSLVSIMTKLSDAKKQLVHLTSSEVKGIKALLETKLPHFKRELSNLPDKDPSLEDINLFLAQQLTT
ncbi:DNA polymerase beta superfamily protein [Priestia sp. GS2]|uniref:DNA polymerase beta superfamily protein n=1 Tax=Priestia sp. GS2 TaxID=3117403 RepID=UPI002EDA0B2C